MDNNSKVGHHISQQFNKELEDIRHKVLTMGGLVEQQVELAVKAFSHADMELAERVIKQDDLVNTMESAIDQECIQIIALRQPTAFDLRLLISVIKLLTEIERVGDNAKRIAQMAIHVANDSDNPDSYYELQHIAEMVRDMLHRALDGFARMDTDEIDLINELDENVNREYKSIMRQLITRMMEDPRNITRSLDILWAARSLERIGDHACNISEYVVYMMKGQDVRHIRNEVA
jgi:phosphate transport system protein